MPRPLTAALRTAPRRALAALVLVTSPALAAAHLPAPGSTYHLLFATSSNSYRTTTTAGLPPLEFRFNGIEGADWQVTSAAFNSELPGAIVWDQVSPIYRAILSISGDNARDRLGVSGPVYNLHGTKLADGHADLFDGNLAAPVEYDQWGMRITENPDVWTGCTAIGSSVNGASCGTWNNVSSVAGGRIGNALSGNSWLSTETSKPCKQGARLFALSPALTAPLWGDYNGDGAVDAADYVIWRKAAGGHSPLGGNRSFREGNLSQPVGPADYAVWRTYFGQTLPAAQIIAVPEPTAAVLFLLAFTAIARHVGMQGSA